MSADKQRIEFLEGVIRTAADRLRNGGAFPIAGETWKMMVAALDGASARPEGATLDAAVKMLMAHPARQRDAHYYDAFGIAAAAVDKMRHAPQSSVQKA